MSLNTFHPSVGPSTGCTRISARLKRVQEHSAPVNLLVRLLVPECRLLASTHVNQGLLLRIWFALARPLCHCRSVLTVSAPGARHECTIEVGDALYIPVRAPPSLVIPYDLRVNISQCWILHAKRTSFSACFLLVIKDPRVFTVIRDRAEWLVPAFVF